MAKKGGNDYIQGIFVPKNPDKYIGKKGRNIIYRSSWERDMMLKFDEHPYVLAWASESVSIKYVHPLTNRMTNYIPDFLVLFADREGRKHCELIEVKPLKEVPGVVVEGRGKSAARTQMAQVVNAAKWAAAEAYCKANNIKFRVATEVQMYKWVRTQK